ncbi:Apoptosis-inducing factor 2 [Gamsiella multidivaricata]|nr:Apoptosis-inducing factor 2 [Gamsiella multidivaricata]
MTKTNKPLHIVVIGGSYGGVACVNKLLRNLPKESNVAITLIESRDAMYHCIASYRALVQKDFIKNLWIPYTNLFLESSPHKVVRGTVEKVFFDHVLLSASEPMSSASDITLADERAAEGSDPHRVDFDYLVIATGSTNPSPSKWRVNNSADGIKLMEKAQEDVRQSERIVVVGGGACGVELASEIKYAFPSKSITLIHSESALVDYPKFPQSFKDEALRYLEKEGVEVILNELAEIPGLSKENSIQRAERTIKLKGSGKTFQSDLQFFSIGLSVDTGLLSTLRPPPESKADGKNKSDKPFDFEKMLNPQTKAIKVKPTLQLEHDAFPHIFAIGDVSTADPVPTCMAAVAAGETCARNLVKLVHKEEKRIARRRSGDEEPENDEADGYLCRSWNKLEDYVPIRQQMVLAMNPMGGVCHLPVVGTWFGGIAAWLVKSGDLFSGRFWRSLNMSKPTS